MDKGYIEHKFCNINDTFILFSSLQERHFQLEHEPITFNIHRDQVFVGLCDVLLQLCFVKFDCSFRLVV